MRRFFRAIRPQSFAEGFLVVLSVVLVVATITMVISYNKPIDASPDTEIRMEAHATENLQDLTASQKDEDFFAQLLHNNIVGRTDKTRRQIAELANNLGDRTYEVLSQPLTELSRLLGFNPDARLDNAEAEVPVDFAVGGLEINLPEEVTPPPAVQESLPGQVPNNPPNTPPTEGETGQIGPQYAPTAPPATNQDQAPSPAYAPTAPPAQNQDQASSPVYAPTAPAASAPTAPASPIAPTQAQVAGSPTAAPTGQFAPTSPQQNNNTPSGGNTPGQNPADNTPTNNASPQNAAEAEAGVFALINEYRTASGLRPLAPNGTIKGICNTRAMEISSFYHSGHLRADGSYALNWIANNWGNNYAQGENIGYLSGIHRLNANTIFDAFYNSGKGHREIMMNPNISIGAVSLYVATDQNRIYVCMNFGN